MRITIFEKNFIKYLKKDTVVRIVMFINDNDWCTLNQINKELKIPKVTLIRRLKILEEGNIIRTERKKSKKNGASLLIYSTHITQKYLR